MRAGPPSAVHSTGRIPGEHPGRSLARPPAYCSLLYCYSCIVLGDIFVGGRRHFCRGGCDIFVARRHWVSLTDIFVGVVFGADIRHAADQRGNVPPISCAVPGVANGHIAQLLQVLHPALDCALRCVVQRAEVGVARVAAARLVGQRGDFCVKIFSAGFSRRSYRTEAGRMAKIQDCP